MHLVDCGRGIEPGQDEYLNAWLDHGGALAIYGSVGGGGRMWLQPAIEAALRRGFRVKVLDLRNPGNCDGLPPGLSRLLRGREITWPLAERILDALKEVLAERDAVLCIRNFAGTFLEPAAAAKSQALAVRDLFAAARAARFPICVAMPTACGFHELIRAFTWVWCLGFDAAAKDREKEVQTFGRAAQLVDPDALWRHPPIARGQAMVVQFGATRTHVMRREIDVQNVFAAA